MGRYRSQGDDGERVAAACRSGQNVETAWLKQTGITAAKDAMTIDQFYKRQNQSEEMIYKVRDPGAALARKLLD